MAINSVPPVSRKPGEVNQQDFLKIMLTQLNAQNPLKPVDNTAFVAQMAQFSQLAQTQEISANISKLLAVQLSTEAIGLLGKTINYSNGLASASGVVNDVSFKGNEPALTIHPSSGTDVPNVTLKQISSVR